MPLPITIPEKNLEDLVNRLKLAWFLVDEPSEKGESTISSRTGKYIVGIYQEYGLATLVLFVDEMVDKDDSVHRIYETCATGGVFEGMAWLERIVALIQGDFKHDPKNNLWRKD